MKFINISTKAINLAGYIVSNNSTFDTMWTFPDTTIEADGYIILFANEKVLEEDATIESYYT